MTLSTPAKSEPPENESDDQRFDRLLAASGPALVRLAASYTNTSGDRDDLFQEIAVALWQALPRFRGESSERTFLFRVAHNRAIDYLRRHRPRSTSIDTDTILTDSRHNPEAGLARAQQGERLRQAIQRLPVPYRQVITLVLEEVSYSEIAQILGITESNVGVRLNRARQLLRTMLDERR
jgi:RNA polymerase sigma factor (sigma-70 family)